MAKQALRVLNSTPSEPITDHDIYLFKEGTHGHLYDKLGAFVETLEGDSGVRFAVWAPNAKAVSVIGEFNNWEIGAHPLEARDDHSGIWQGFVAGVLPGATYKYHLASRFGGYQVAKGDPFARHWEVPPSTASRVWTFNYTWGDEAWMAGRAKANAIDAPMSIYEIHLGSWRRVVEEDNRCLSYRELAHQLGDHVAEMGFTHVELLPVTEHPFYGSWGYQTTGYFAPTARYGPPEDFMYLVDQLHQRGIGVILDWVPSHFPSDEHGLCYFDGTHLFEHRDPKQGYHPEWNSYIFNYGRHEVRAFLISSALYWLKYFHIDGLRVDAVASMLYLDYARSAGEWIPNQHGGRENLAAIQFLRDLNQAVYRDFPDVQTIAEESTAWPMVSRPTYVGGLGFGLKWNMGWMHDTLKYFALDPVHRKYHHDQLTFSLIYAFNENFVSPLSHDEVVHGKGSLLTQMPGDDWQRFANLRLLLSLLYTHPGKKLLFMGGEWGQWREWNHDESLDWHLLDGPQGAFHGGVKRLVQDLNSLLRRFPALYRQDTEPAGFEWIDCHDFEQSTLSFLRHAPGDESLLVVVNATPVTRFNFRIGTPTPGVWREVFNSDAPLYGGGGQGNLGAVESVPLPAQGRLQSLTLTLPPLGLLIFVPDPEQQRPEVLL